MIKTSHNSVDCVIFSLTADAARRQYLYDLLSDDEKQRAARYRFDKHRQRFIVGRGSIREILAHYCRLGAAEIRFDLSHYGKPSLYGTDDRIQFNASSSELLGGMAIAQHMSLGFDLEKIKPDKSEDYDLIVANQFTEAEKTWYMAHENKARIQAFFELWTCKEAYLKALGVGLSGQLDSFAIGFDEHRPHVAETRLEEGQASRLSLFRVNVDSEFLACLAVPVTDCRINLSHWPPDREH